MTKRGVAALVKRLKEINVEVVESDAISVLIKGEDYLKVVTLAKGAKYITKPRGMLYLELS